MPNNTNVTYQEATFDFSDGWIIHHSPNFALHGNIVRQDSITSDGKRKATFTINLNSLTLESGSYFGFAWQMLLVIMPSSNGVLDQIPSDSIYDTLNQYGAKPFLIFDPEDYNEYAQYIGAAPCTWYIPFNSDNGYNYSGFDSTNDGYKDIGIPNRDWYGGQQMTDKINSVLAAKGITNTLEFEGVDETDPNLDQFNIMVFTRCGTVIQSSGCTILVNNEDREYQKTPSQLPYIRVKYNESINPPIIESKPDPTHLNFRSLTITPHTVSGRGVKLDIAWQVFKPPGWTEEFGDKEYRPGLCVRLSKKDNNGTTTLLDRSEGILVESNSTNPTDANFSPASVVFIRSDGNKQWDPNIPNSSNNLSIVRYTNSNQDQQVQWKGSSDSSNTSNDLSIKKLFNIYNTSFGKNTEIIDYNGNKESVDVEYYSVSIFYAGLDMGSKYVADAALYREEGGLRWPEDSTKFISTEFDTYGTKIDNTSSTDNSINFKCSLTKPTKTEHGNYVRYRYGTTAYDKNKRVDGSKGWTQNGSSGDATIYLANLTADTTYYIQSIAGNATSTDQGITAVTGYITDKGGGIVGISANQNDTNFESNGIKTSNAEIEIPDEPGGGSSGCAHKLTIEVYIDSINLETSCGTLMCEINYRVRHGCTADSDHFKFNSNFGINVSCSSGDSKFFQFEGFNAFENTERASDYVAIVNMVKIVQESGTFKVGFTGLNEGTNYTVTVGGNTINIRVPSGCSSKLKSFKIPQIVRSAYTRQLITSYETTSRCIRITGTSFRYPNDYVLVKIDSNDGTTSTRIRSGSNTGSTFNKLSHNTTHTVIVEIVDCFAFNSNGERTNNNDSTVELYIRTKLLSILITRFTTYQHAIECIAKMQVDSTYRSTDAICNERFSIVNDNHKTYAEPFGSRGYLNNQVINKNTYDSKLLLYSGYYNYSNHEATVRFNKLSNYYCWYILVVTGTDGYNEVTTSETQACTQFPFSWIYSNGSWKRYMSYVHDGSKYIPAPVFVHNDGRYIEANGNRPEDEASDSWIKYSRNDRTNYPD